MASSEAVEAALRMLDAAGLRESTKPADKTEAVRRLAAYVAVLAELSDDDVPAAAVCWMRKSRFFPTPGDLYGEARPQIVAAADSTSEASRAYQRVMSCNTYAPEAGAFWSYRQIATEVGQAAADAFVAAGGHEAFAVTDPVGDQFRFKRFMEGYKEALEARGAEARMISAGGSVRGISAGEASSLVAQIAARAPERK